MAGPYIFGQPFVLLFLYFIFYSFAGWVWETVYCSIVERRLVARGFLYGPVCPIYGAGVIIMNLFFTPFKDNLLVFYLVSVVVMTLWEYAVAWLLETTTHIKYWDYSQFHFNYKGRVCLAVSLFWGILSYLAVFWIHPFVSSVILQIPEPILYAVFWISLLILLLDTATTIGRLAQVTQILGKMRDVGGELTSQLVKLRDGVSDGISDVGEQIRQRLGHLPESLPEGVSDQLKRLAGTYDDLVASASKVAGRFRRRYSEMSSKYYPLEDVDSYDAILKKAKKSVKDSKKKQ